MGKAAVFAGRWGIMDGRWDLRDFAALQSCFYTLAATNTCAAVDYDRSLLVDLSDYGAFVTDFIADGP